MIFHFSEESKGNVQFIEVERKSIIPSPMPKTNSSTENEAPTVLCFLDYILNNLIIYKSISKHLKLNQGFGEIAEMLFQGVVHLKEFRVVFILAGRADLGQSPSVVAKSAETVLANMRWKNPRIMCLINALLHAPNDTDEQKLDIIEINRKLNKIADKDEHWLFYNPNPVLALGGIPDKRYFDRLGFLNRSGCMQLARAVTTQYRDAKMQQNFDALPAWKP